MREGSNEKEQSFPTQPPLAIAYIQQRLHVISPKIKQDPDYLQKLPRIPSITLLKSTPYGGKFWTGAIAQNGVHLHWGRLGTTGNTKLISNCNNRAMELLQRCNRKLQNGYTIQPSGTYLP